MNGTPRQRRQDLRHLPLERLPAGHEQQRIEIALHDTSGPASSPAMKSSGMPVSQPTPSTPVSAA